MGSVLTPAVEDSDHFFREAGSLIKALRRSLELIGSRRRRGGISKKLLLWCLKPS